ncbi:MAG: hypothetical protein NT081_06815 [Actinobacteria bacterium]|nr:hypothetical protein [Actinomycetota bacterium]
MTPRFTPSRLISAIVLTLTILLALASCGGTSSKVIETTTSESTTTTTAAPTTTTTVDPGTLPQTDEKPTGTGAEFENRMKVLANAIITNTPDTAVSAFFPVSAYKQTKKNTDPAADWKNRLIANFKVDVADANKKLGTNAKTAVFTGVTVPATAVWVKPGEEYNVGPYWRVFKALMNFTVDGKNVQIPIESMISWRGQWYVVHLGTIR